MTQSLTALDFRFAAILPASLLLLLGACSGEASQDGAAGSGEAHDGNATWSYEGETGPEHWGDLDPTYVLAKTGKEQSPIDLDPAASTAEGADALAFAYQPTTLEVLHNGHTVEDNYNDGGSIELGGTEYKLAQFHFHSPSEHTVAGKHAAAEMHFVHHDADGGLAVVAVFIDEGAENAVFKSIGNYLPEEVGRADHVDGISIDATALLPTNRATWRYDGSLTTPPCSEGVRWVVMKEHITASAEQIERFRRLYGGNNRPTQPLNGRELVTAP